MERLAGGGGAQGALMGQREVEPAWIKVGRALTTRPNSLDLIPSEKESGGSKWGVCVCVCVVVVGGGIAA